MRKYINLCKKFYGKAPIIYCNEHWYKKYFGYGFDDVYFWNADISKKKVKMKHSIKQTKIDYAKGFYGKVDYDIIYDIESLLIK